MNQLIDSFESVIGEAARTEPGLVQTAALGTVLQSFYNGVEGVFRRIAKDIDQSTPGGDAWHSALLASMARPAECRGPVITETLRLRLREYLQFRHVFRATYAVLLRWDRMSPLVAGLPETLRLFEAEITAFLATRPE